MYVTVLPTVRLVSHCRTNTSVLCRWFAASSSAAKETTGDVSLFHLWPVNCASLILTFVFQFIWKKMSVFSALICCQNLFPCVYDFNTSRRGSRILKWGVNFCNNVIEPKPGWGFWGLCISKETRGLRKRGGENSPISTPLYPRLTRLLLINNFPYPQGMHI